MPSSFRWRHRQPGRGVEASWSGFDRDLVLYPAFSMGLQAGKGHSIWFTFSAISAHSYQPRMPGGESGTNLYLRSYPLGLEYRYRILRSALFNPYLKGSLLLIPIRDGWETDTPAEYRNTTNRGADFGLGAEGKVWGRLGLFSAVSYRLVNDNSERPPQHIDFDGFYAQLGLNCRNF